MSVEDEKRRQIRRERNKIAAARCRKRRMDHTNELLEVLLCCKRCKFAIISKYKYMHVFRVQTKLNKLDID